MECDKVKSLPAPVRALPVRTRLVHMKYRKGDTPVLHSITAESATYHDVAMQPTIPLEVVASRQNTSVQPSPSHRAQTKISFHLFDEDISNKTTIHLVRLSGMMPAIRIPKPGTAGNAQSINGGLRREDEEGYWPYGIKRTGPLPVLNLYGREPFGRTMPHDLIGAPAIAPEVQQTQPAWKAFLNNPTVKVTVGLLIGVGLLLLVARFVNLPATIAILRMNLATPQGILLALLSGIAFLLAFSVRGVRWKLFLNPVAGDKVSTFKVIQLFFVSIFLNFLLPIQGGEVAKCLMLKRIADISISRSLPTVAMDRSLDLMPALFIIIIVPFLGIQMDIKLWLVLGFVVGLLIIMILFIGLAAWKQTTAVALLKKITSILPKAIGDNIEGFSTGFIDSLLMGASRPKIFLPAILLTCIALTFDGVFAMLAFWTIGYHIPLTTAIFGYTMFSLFTVLPTPPGQIGSNEVVGLLVFTGLLHLPKNNVIAMFLFSHPWAALIMFTTGITCLSALGLTISGIMKVQSGKSDIESEEEHLYMSHPEL